MLILSYICSFLSLLFQSGKVSYWLIWMVREIEQLEYSSWGTSKIHGLVGWAGYGYVRVRVTFRIHSKANLLLGTQSNNVNMSCCYTSREIFVSLGLAIY